MSAPTSETFAQQLQQLRNDLIFFICASAASRDAGIESVRKNGATTVVNDLTGT